MTANARCRPSFVTGAMAIALGLATGGALAGCGKIIGIEEHEVAPADADVAAEVEAGDGDGAAPMDAEGADGGDGSPSDTCHVNLVPNGDFETSLQGWSAVNGTVERVPGGRDGGGTVARVCRSGGSSGAYYSLQIDQPVETAPAGADVRMTLWAKANPPDQAFQAAIRGQRPDGGVDSQFDNENAGDGWSQLVVTYTAAADGTRVDVYVAVTNPPAPPACFDVDDICVETF